VLGTVLGHNQTHIPAMFNLRSLKRFLLMQAMPDEGGGGAPDAAVVDVAADGVPADAPAQDAPAVDAPKTMLDAITQSLARDELGRFTSKTEVGAPAPPAAAAPAAAVAAQVVPATPKPEDLTAMPEGLQPAAQARFQALANANRELTEKYDNSNRQVEYVRETFGQHGINQVQFEQAANVLGMMNRGDLRGALKVLDEQRAHISLALGEALPGIDALAGHPDLRQAVDGLEITEARALEVARLRQQAQTTERAQQQHQQSTQQAQAAEQEFKRAQIDVDAFCQQMAKDDINYQAIEALLLPAIGKLLEGVPAPRWAAVVKNQYEFIKSALRTARPAAPVINALRATGAASPAQAPKTAYEAMWGTPQPRA